MTIQAQRSEHPSWAWILANAAGFAMGGAIAGAVALAALDPLVGTVASQLSAAAALAPVSAVSSGLLGTAAGLLQWAVLRRRSSATVWWIVATAGDGLPGELSPGRSGDSSRGRSRT